MSKITVVIPVYNRSSYLSQAVESILRQTCEDWELLIIDDASTDDSVEVASRFLAHPRIHLIEMPYNLGTGKTLNFALSQITSPYFVILDSDDWLEPNALELLLEAIETQPQTVSLVYGNTIRWKQEERGLKLRSVQKYRSFQDRYDFIMYPYIPYPRFLRTESVREVGGFEPDIPYEGRLGEDRYLLLKLINISQFHWIDVDLYNYRIHTTNLTKIDRAKFATVRRWLYTKMLEHWGGHYKPVFEMRKDGWLVLKELIPNDEQQP
ncbi:glycosyltransferase family 2 protein [Ammoniphilus sp. CFH 90114]|uniref:glycosyltransferase family 2 protein n=1 Tax=Ammoniphilus sp. CFH 90114 TaxID=2493665 RepID=UPI0013E95F01|nr:glycosyltransferase family 2 protein [Ammoniphilus sp. CFH 90114]